jgi:hypothetical protein
MTEPSLQRWIDSTVRNVLLGIARWAVSARSNGGPGSSMPQP